MKSVRVLVILSAFSALLPWHTPAEAQRRSGLDSMQFATQLGSVLAAERFCELRYDQAAIRALIEARVAADDMQFPSTLNMMTVGSEAQQRDMSVSSKVAHCTQIGRIARSFGFVR
jgi:hypothetical protein